MRDSQRLVLRAGEIRTRLSELAGVTELSDEQRSEIDTLRNEYGDVERRQAAALIAEDVPEETRTDETSEDGELRELRGRVQFTEYVGAALEMRAASGAELEYNQTLGCQRRSKISPPGRSKTSPLNVMRYAVLGGCPGSP